MVLNYPNLYIKSIIGLLILFYFPKVEAQMSHKTVLSIHLTSYYRNRRLGDYPKNFNSLFY